MRGDPSRASEMVQAIEAAVDPEEWVGADLRPDPDQGAGRDERRRTCARLRAPVRPLPRRRDPAALAHVPAGHRGPRGRGGPHRASGPGRTGRSSGRSTHVGDHPSARVTMAVARRWRTSPARPPGRRSRKPSPSRVVDAWPFELANARLEHGVWLRRQRRPTLAPRAAAGRADDLRAARGPGLGGDGSFGATGGRGGDRHAGGQLLVDADDPGAPDRAAGGDRAEQPGDRRRRCSSPHAPSARTCTTRSRSWV